MKIAYDMFDDLDGKFEARLREHKTITKSSRFGEGDITVSSARAILEVRFEFDVLERLLNPTFVALEAKVSGSEINEYLVYEVVGLKPIHFQMLGMDVAMPTVIRKEYLDKIRSSWENSEETWIDIIAIPTQYMMEIDKEGEVIFSRTKKIPLVGSIAHLLAKDIVKKFLCYEEGTDIGELIGFDMPLTVNMDSLIKYHTGIFGFTGVGKSNLMSFLIRKAITDMEDIHVVIFDIAGEYAIHLLDLLLSKGKFLTTENLEDDTQKFLDSQTIPETLEDSIPYDHLNRAVDILFKEKRIRKMSIADEKRYAITVGLILNTLESTIDKGMSGKIQAIRALEEIRDMANSKGWSEETEIRNLSERDRIDLLETLSQLRNGLTERAALRNDVDTIIDYIEYIPTKSVEDEGSRLITPERLARDVVFNGSERLNIVYIPEPIEARDVVSRFVDELLILKKIKGIRKKILVVLDEAQEYIPDRQRQDDHTDDSNRSVESLLRQGRKYRAHCWLATQRVAHLNVSALQQLHSYFVSTLPRFYDRMVIADAFSLSYDILEKTTELDTGEWIFVSYRATKQKNVPAFIRAPDNEKILIRNLANV